MKRKFLFLVLLAGLPILAMGDSAPAPGAFRVLPLQPAGPQITSFLKYETEIAWREDAQRVKLWSSIRSQQDLLRVQNDLRRKLLAMFGGLPAQKTQLNARIVGRIAMNGFHIEKLIFESLPGIYVTALVYVPEDGAKVHPAVLVPCGHSPDGKAHYQALGQRLAQRGYVVICWDPVGQGERSQFWDLKTGKNRYNLICAEHAVLGNLAYLAGTNLARWEIWDGMRAIDYLLTRPDVDAKRINITGTSGGGFQTAHIAALDARIKVAIPSCYITALPMRMYNRIFKDPDSDPEQDLYGMLSNGVDHAGLLLLMYPRPVFVAAAVLDFFPIEGTHKTFREVAEFYARFQHGDRIAMTEGYHGHEYSDHNQEAAFEFLDHFNGLPARHELAPVKVLDAQTLQCTKTGQVMLDFADARSLMEEISSYREEHKTQHSKSLAQLYYSEGYAGVKNWKIGKYDGLAPAAGEIAVENAGSSSFDNVAIDRYILHHSGDLAMPLLHIYRDPKSGGEVKRAKNVLLWFGKNGKATEDDWPELIKYLDAGYEVVTFDFRGQGENRMQYKAVSEDDPSLANLDFAQAYVSPISGVLADYVYNSLLIGRPYFLQMMEDVEIAARFSRQNLHTNRLTIGGGGASWVADAVAKTIPGITLMPRTDAEPMKWSELVRQRREVWPIEYLLPGGAYLQ